MALPLFTIPGASEVRAVGNSQENNIVGIHGASITEADIQDISELVGTWGYVTVVIQETDRDTGKWQNMFSLMKQHKLIPIVRLATRVEGSSWRRPTPEDAGQWLSFLNSLSWPTPHKYVILFNEPNHGSEWGGTVNPEDYGRVARSFAQTLHNSNNGYIVMLAGMDSAAPSKNPAYEDQSTFYNRMVSEFPVEEINKTISALASHSYPNPGFSGKPTDTGRATIRGYEWELDLLKRKGVKELPVFITETGWPRNTVGETKAAEYLTYAFREVWFKDQRIRAVTPFLFNYEAPPLNQWSWKKPSGKGFYQQYHAISSLGKIPGNPLNQSSGTKSRIFRFGGPRYGNHFYTAGVDERNTVIFTYPNSAWTYEGPAFNVYNTQVSGTIPVYRFRDERLGVHFYTAGQSEKDNVQKNYADKWVYEGVAFFVYPTPGRNRMPVYRFRNEKLGIHFYTSGEEEKQTVIDRYPDKWKLEGVAFYVPND